MSAKRVMVIGLEGSGKSELSDLIEGEVLDRVHREDCCYRKQSFLVPGRYIENNWMHSIVLMLAQNQASAMVLLIDGKTLESRYSSGYVRAFTVPCLGVLTNVSGLSERARTQGLAMLKAAGCKETLCVSTDTGEGIEAFMRWVNVYLPNAEGQSDCYREEESCVI